MGWNGARRTRCDFFFLIYLSTVLDLNVHSFLTFILSTAFLPWNPLTKRRAWPFDDIPFHCHSELWGKNHPSVHKAGSLTKILGFFGSSFGGFDDSYAEHRLQEANTKGVTGGWAWVSTRGKVRTKWCMVFMPSMSNAGSLQVLLSGMVVLLFLSSGGKKKKKREVQRSLLFPNLLSTGESLLLSRIETSWWHLRGSFLNQLSQAGALRGSFLILLLGPS